MPQHGQSKSLVWDRAKTYELFTRYREDPDPAIRDELVKMYLNLVEYLARRFKNRGEPLEDLIQVGTIGLIKAIDRFDTGREVEFTTYATPTIVGELKRYFRDKGWAIRVPRRLQELNLQINQKISNLTQELRRTPTINEIAKKVGVTPEDVIEAMETSEAYNFISLDGDLSSESGESFSLLEYIGEDDKRLASLEDRASLAAALKDLSPQEQKILYLRFFRGLTQTEIAGELDISQMHVSRLLRRTLQILRQRILTQEE
ncbi:MAG TPA: SigB/SigF/SigG family RNA polymerase sigma factor [Actinobacteria bacterium]|nr:SigB/SigF/SigG family RNA polymerase sigma factor [Actinomycetota bacterium]